jgi:hypothetical protein
VCVCVRVRVCVRVCVCVCVCVREREREREPDFPEINEFDCDVSFLLLNMTVNIVSMSQPPERLFVLVFINKTLNMSCY